MIFKHCIYCGGKLQAKEGNVFTCGDCGKETYNNAAACVAIFILNPDKTKVLLAVRGIEPQKGKLDSLGGFINPGEKPIEAAEREVFEETTLYVTDLSLISTNTNHYQGETFAVSIIYVAENFKGKPKAQDDVADLVWVELQGAEDKDYAFDWINEALIDLKAWLKENK